MNSKKKWVGLTAVILAATTVAACSSSGSTKSASTAAASGGTINVLVVADQTGPNADFHAGGSAQGSEVFVAEGPASPPGHAGVCGKAGFAQDG